MKTATHKNCSSIRRGAETWLETKTENTTHQERKVHGSTMTTNQQLSIEISDKILNTVILKAIKINLTLLKRNQLCTVRLSNLLDTGE